MNFSANISLIFPLYFLLVLYGVIYNQFYAWMERQKYSEGYHALLMAGFILVTLAATALIEPLFALIALGAFAASGIPLMVGSIARYMRLRKKEQDHVRSEKTPPLA